MFNFPLIKRLKQTLCRHNYFPVAIAKMENEYSNVLYECKNCGHMQIPRRTNN